MVTFRQLQQLLLPMYSYRERSELLRRMDEMEREKKRLISEYEASCSS